MQFTRDLIKRTFQCVFLFSRAINIKKNFRQINFCGSGFFLLRKGINSDVGEKLLIQIVQSRIKELKRHSENPPDLSLKKMERFAVCELNRNVESWTNWITEIFYNQMKIWLSTTLLCTENQITKVSWIYYAKVPINIKISPLLYCRIIFPVNSSRFEHSSEYI